MTYGFYIGIFFVFIIIRTTILPIFPILNCANPNPWTMEVSISPDLWVIQ